MTQRPPTPPSAAPRSNPWGEAARFVRGVSTLPWLALQTPRMRASRPKNVVVLPGFLTTDASTLALRSFLRAIGHRPRGWGLGRNDGDVKALVPRVVSLLKRQARRGDGPVSVVGWSLGGVIAREATRQVPDAVREIITLGTPVVGGPKYTAAANYYRTRGIDIDAVAAAAARRNIEPLPVPITAVYSRVDAVVAWEACFDPNPDNRVRHVEVSAGHAEMGFSAEVFEVVAAGLQDT